jgi:hypothetical protein
LEKVELRSTLLSSFFVLLLFGESENAAITTFFFLRSFSARCFRPGPKNDARAGHISAIGERRKNVLITLTSDAACPRNGDDDAQYLY